MPYNSIQEREFTTLTSARDLTALNSFNVRRQAFYSGTFIGRKQ